MHYLILVTFYLARPVCVPARGSLLGDQEYLSFSLAGIHAHDSLRSCIRGSPADIRRPSLGIEAGMHAARTEHSQ